MENYCNLFILQWISGWVGQPGLWRLECYLCKKIWYNIFVTMALSIPFSLLRTITRNSLHFLKLQTHISHNLGGTNLFKFEILIILLGIFFVFLCIAQWQFVNGDKFLRTNWKHFSIYFNKFSFLKFWKSLTHYHYKLKLLKWCQRKCFQSQFSLHFWGDWFWWGNQMLYILYKWILCWKVKVLHKFGIAKIRSQKVLKIVWNEMKSINIGCPSIYFYADTYTIHIAITQDHLQFVKVFHPCMVLG